MDERYKENTENEIAHALSVYLITGSATEAETDIFTSDFYCIFTSFATL